MKLNRNTLPTVAAAGAFGFFGIMFATESVDSEPTNPQNRSPLIQSNVTDAAKGQTSAHHGLLRIGDKITLIPEFRVAPGHKSSSYFASSPGTYEDIVEIQSRQLNRELIKAAGKSTSYYAAAFLITAHPDGIYSSIAVYDPDTKVVEQVTNDYKLANSNQTFYIEGPTDPNHDIAVQIKPHESHDIWGVTVAVSTVNQTT